MYKNVKYYIFLHLYTLLYTFNQFCIFLYVFFSFRDTLIRIRGLVFYVKIEDFAPCLVYVLRMLH